MSLIEEALRRVQDPVVSSQQAAPPKPARKEAKEPAETPAHSWPAAPPTPASGAPAQRATNALMAVAVVVMALTVALIAGGAMWMIRMGDGSAPASVQPPPPALQPAVETPMSEPARMSDVPTAAAPVERLAPPTPLAQQDELRLSGIVEGVGDPYAVINGGIVGLGERVGRFTLVAIHNGAAVLRRDDGTDTILRVSPH
ncbi:MAG: hypothetical protein HY599_04005 [Candidatus Omnitrophica bacterium]|nr:hypothetical protein [Candidatus Omnitrophota bacterium]